MRKSYANLDILRSLAVMSVVAQHLWHQCVNFNLCNYDPIINQRLHNLSFTGVMFFFVHTCLVLMGSMQRAPEVCWTSRFLIRRAFRIYPLCWATIVLVLATGLSDQPGGNIHDLGWRGNCSKSLSCSKHSKTFSERGRSAFGVFHGKFRCTSCCRRSGFS